MSEKAPKIQKKFKFPGFFKELYPLKKFEKGILKRIYLPREKEFLLSFYERQSSQYVLLEQYKGKKECLDKKTFQRLKGLGQSIKKNGSLVDWFKILLVGTLLSAAGVILVLLFPSWLQNTVENSLEDAFQAKVDLQGFEMDLLAGVIRFESMAIADKNDPMKNLIEMDRGGFELNTSELLSGRYHVESIRAEGMKWGTERSISGALPPREGSMGGTRSDGGEGTGGDEGFLGGFFQEGLGQLIPEEITSLDPAVLLEAQIEQLASPQLLDRANSSYEEMEERWSSKGPELTEKTQAFTQSATAIVQRDLSKINSLIQVQQLLEEANRLGNQYQSLSRDVGNALNQVKNDWEEVGSYQVQVTEALVQDRAHLQSLVSLPLAGENSLASNLVMAPLAKALGQYGPLVFQGMDLIQGLSAPAKEKPQPKVREGKSLAVPIPLKPLFLIKDTSISIGTLGQRGYHSIEMANITSDPELWPGDLFFSYSAQVEKPTMDLSLTWPYGEEPLVFDFAYRGQDFSQKEGLQILEIGEIQGVLSLTGQISFLDQDHYHLSLNVVLSNLSPTYTAQGEIGRLMRTVFSRTSSLDLALSLHQEGGQGQLNMSSNIDQIIAETLQAWLGEKVSQARQEIMKEFNALIADSLGENAQLVQDIEGYLEDLEKGQLSLGSAQRQLESKKKDIEKRITEFATQNLPIPENIRLPGF